MNRKKLLILAIAGALSFTTLSAPVLAAQAAPSTVSDYNTLISELTSEESEVASKLEALQSDIKDNQNKTAELVTEMEATQKTLVTLQDEIETLKEVIARREDHLAEQARSVQVMGNTGNLISFVLSAESLDELVGKIDVVTKMVGANRSTIKKQEEDKELVEEKEAETLVKQEEQQVLASELEANQSELEERKAEEETMLAEIAAKKAVAQDERDRLLAQAAAAEARRRALASARTATVTVASSNTSSSENSGAVTPSSSPAAAPAPAPAPAAAPAPAPAANNGSLLGIAHSLKGVRYVYGGSTTAGFDCSGFTRHVFQQAGRSIPRSAAAQYSATSRVSRAQAQPGDLIFFSLAGRGVNHVGIYLGGGNFIGSQTSTGVAVASINSGYWANKVVGFGR